MKFSLDVWLDEKQEKVSFFSLSFVSETIRKTFLVHLMCFWLLKSEDKLSSGSFLYEFNLRRQTWRQDWFWPRGKTQKFQSQKRKEVFSVYYSNDIDTAHTVGWMELRRKEKWKNKLFSALSRNCQKWITTFHISQLSHFLIPSFQKRWFVPNINQQFEGCQGGKLW